MALEDVVGQWGCDWARIMALEDVSDSGAVTRRGSWRSKTFRTVGLGLGEDHGAQRRLGQWGCGWARIMTLEDVGQRGCDWARIMALEDVVGQWGCGWARIMVLEDVVGQWGCGWSRIMALEDVGVLTFGIAVPRAVDEQQMTTRASLNTALLQLERENFFDTLHNK